MQLDECATTPELLATLASRYSAEMALIDGEEAIDFATLRERVLAFAGELIDRGLGPGNRVGVLMGNSALWLVSAMGIQSIGATAVALNTWFTSRELGYVVGHARLDAVVAAREFNGIDYRRLLSSLTGAEHPHLRTLFFPDAEERASLTTAMRVRVEALAASINPSSAAYLLYTSGSTAQPKGVMIGHRAMIEVSAQAARRFGFVRGDRLFLPISLFWAAGCLNGTMAAWISAAAVVLQEKFDVGQSFQIIDRHRCTAMFAAEKMLTAMIDHPDAAAARPFLRKGMVSGPSAFVRRLAGTLLPDACQAFGLTETHGFVTAGDVRDDIDRRASTYGRPIGGVELRIVDPASDRLSDVGEKGEIRVRGPFEVRYLDDPDATALAHDEDGFFKTGDIGSVDPEGCLHFHGRLKDMLKINGMNVSPAEVEDLLLRHPLVAEAYVIGLAAAEKEEVAAIIVPAGGVSIEADALAAFCKEQLAAYKRPRRFLIAASGDIPLTSSGKVHRAALAGMFGAAAGVAR